MSWHKFSDYLNKLKLGELTPIIAVYGSDRFLRKQVIDAVSKKLGEGKHLDQESFYGSESGPTGILAACQTYSMFTQLKLVLVLQFQSLVAAQRTQLMTYLDNPNPTVELILLADPPEEHFEEKRFKEWFTGASKKIDVVDVSGVSDKEISALFKQMVKDYTTFWSAIAWETSGRRDWIRWRR